MPVTVSLLTSLLFIVVISRFSRNLLYAVLPAILFLVFSNGFTLSSSGQIIFKCLFALNGIMLMLVVFQVIWLSQQMKDSGVMNDLVSLVRKSFSGKLSMALLPASIGILPMPGGALFSAPLVDECDSDRTIDPLLKTRINYWFRHIWEYWWPLYPGVLLAVDISGISMWQFILLQLPMTFFSILIGYFFLLKRVPFASCGKHRLTCENVRGLVRLMMPVIIVVSVSVALRFSFPSLVKLNKYIPISLGIAAAMLFLQLKRPLSLDKWKTNIFSPRVIKLFILIEAIRIFGAFVDADLPGGMHLAEQMHSELNSWHIPLILVLILIPFITGVTTGIAFGFVGASFPVVMQLMGPEPSNAVFFSTVAIAYGCGYMGMLLSPVHICLIVTNEHFRTGLLSSIKALFLPVAVLFAVLILYSALLRWFLFI